MTLCMWYQRDKSLFHVFPNLVLVQGKNREVPSLGLEKGSEQQSSKTRNDQGKNNDLHLLLGSAPSWVNSCGLIKLSTSHLVFLLAWPGQLSILWCRVLWGNLPITLWTIFVIKPERIYWNHLQWNEARTNQHWMTRLRAKDFKLEATKTTSNTSYGEI